MGRLIQTLKEGPLDVVGDVHGEIDALNSLLDRLGYDHAGRHKDHRTLVFVGDLCDRGPDSPGVIRKVQQLVDDGRAQLVAGNHELNLLRGLKKHGNHWFCGEANEPGFGHCAAIPLEQQSAILSFFRSLPLALERRDLRIVHAAWLEPTIDRLRSVDEPIDVAYAVFHDAQQREPAFRALKERYDEESKRLGDAIRSSPTVPNATVIGLYGEALQMGNPVRIASSGVERATNRPFYAAGEWHFVRRIAWWREYQSEIPVVFGHYWRWWDPTVHATLSKGEPQLFADDAVGPYMADHHNAYCVDFSVDARFKERLAGTTAGFHGRLAAVRWPERITVYDGDRSAATDSER